MPEIGGQKSRFWFSGFEIQPCLFADQLDDAFHEAVQTGALELTALLHELRTEEFGNHKAKIKCQE
jgi:hypothetical protein